jgi:arsenite/tail-anchored protein-transporting ATPase
MSPGQPSFLEDHGLRLLLFGGKGGVGKTSCAAATALRLANHSPQAKFLLVSTDPAHSLGDSLAGALPPPNLQINELNAQECLTAFKQKHGWKLAAIASRGTFLDEGDIHRLMDLSLPGLDELMALLEISRWVQADSFRCIVVDTAPSGHTLRLLGMPALIRHWSEAMNALLGKYRLMKALYDRSWRGDDVDSFVSNLTSSVNEVESLLRDATRCLFVPVMNATKLDLSETDYLLGELQRVQIPVQELIINGIYPQNGCRLCSEERRRQFVVLDQVRGHPNFSTCSLWGIPLYAAEVCGLKALAAFWECEVAIHDPPEAQPSSDRPCPPQVESSLKAPLSEQTFLLFAGKGGVGKTTMACATALRLVQDFPKHEILLFSADPAHSLSACLEIPIGSVPTPVCPGLTAIELNAPAEFQAVKQLYDKELHAFFEALLPNLDLPFDRTAMERILDLSPPGIDEVIALTRIMELMDQGGYHAVVVDSAPTGHLIRLLEMPELLDHWLKVFFGLFLKYKQIFRLPQVIERLVKISKNLKRLRVILGDPSQCAMYAVSILTEMALAETKDLVTASRRLGFRFSGLILNQVTPFSDCPLCQALNRRELVTAEKYREAFPTYSQVLIYRGGEPRGLDLLRGLAQALYDSPAEILHHV